MKNPDLFNAYKADLLVAAEALDEAIYAHLSMVSHPDSEAMWIDICQQLRHLKDCLVLNDFAFMLLALGLAHYVLVFSDDDAIDSLADRVRSLADRAMDVMFYSLAKKNN